MKFYNRTPETFDQFKAKLTVIYKDSMEHLNNRQELDLGQAKYLCGVFEVLYLSDLIFDDEEYERISNLIDDKYKAYYIYKGVNTMTSKDIDKIAQEARYLASFMNTEEQYINILTYISQRCEQLIADANRATTKRAVDQISSEVYAMQMITKVLKIKIEFPFDYIIGTAWDSYFEDNAM